MARTKTGLDEEHRRDQLKDELKAKVLNKEKSNGTNKQKDSRVNEDKVSIPKAIQKQVTQTNQTAYSHHSKKQ